MNVRITPRALAEAKRIKTWWRHHRLGNPVLFENELEVALERIVAKPDIGTPYEGSQLKVPVLRLLMPRTKLADEAERVKFKLDENTPRAQLLYGH